MRATVVDADLITLDTLLLALGVVEDGKLTGAAGAHLPS